MELSKAALKRNVDLALPASIIAGFVTLAAQRLGTVPVPDKGDEAFMLQVPYEILYRGKFALPMYRFLGGNIENAWHSLRPVYFLSLSAFYKIFGLGLTQGRAFNLLTAALTLLIVYLIGRRMVSWQAGLIAVLMLISDLLFFERARMLRNDFPAAMFALFAFYLFEKAEKKRRPWLYFFSGLSAGAGVMCHTNVVYLIAALGLLMLLADGLSLFRGMKLYILSSGVLVATSYEIVYGIFDYKNLRLQYRGDNAHFSILSWPGFWQNLLEEPQRYTDWYDGGVMFGAVPRTLSHVFQYLTIAALVYLIARSVREFRRGTAMAEPRARFLVVTLVGALFFALFTRNTGYYIIHLECWYALAEGAAHAPKRCSLLNARRTCFRLSTGKAKQNIFAGGAQSRPGLIRGIQTSSEKHSTRRSLSCRRHRAGDCDRVSRRRSLLCDYRTANGSCGRHRWKGLRSADAAPK